MCKRVTAGKRERNVCKSGNVTSNVAGINDGGGVNDNSNNGGEIAAGEMCKCNVIGHNNVVVCEVGSKIVVVHRNRRTTNVNNNNVS